MTHTTRLLALALCSALLGACANDEPDKAGTLLQDQVEALDKARAVEETLLKSSQQQRDTIDKQSR
jgi:hypothetical protein